ncbi:GNAT family N-acetyltransferase [Rhodococcus sp. OK302]|uniref:GNAT family N-acetyltransferase n=1 Tax=Rhodococcus sp. OK302 TaxID=1882769 RepID=UPI001595384E|nr:GNAT family N-acetyltransferase [Rhodococcus sp. OK302]
MSTTTDITTIASISRPTVPIVCHRTLSREHHVVIGVGPKRRLLDSPHRGRGSGRALIAAAEQQHRSTGRTQVWFGFVDDREKNALGLYANLGFTIADTVREMPGVAKVIGNANYVSRSGTWFYKTF